MWQITWMLSLIPDWIWSAVLIVGILAVLASWVLKFVPFVNVYKLPIQVVGVLCLLVGVYFQGVIANEAKYKSENERLEKLINEAKEQSSKANEKLSEAIKERDSAVANKGKTIIQKVDKWLTADPVTITKDMSPEERDKFEKQLKELRDANANCPVPSLVIQGINEAAKAPAKGESK